MAGGGRRRRSIRRERRRHAARRVDRGRSRGCRCGVMRGQRQRTPPATAATDATPAAVAGRDCCHEIVHPVAQGDAPRATTPRNGSAARRVPVTGEGEEFAAQRLARPEQQRLDSAHRDVVVIGDLLVAPALRSRAARGPRGDAGRACHRGVQIGEVDVVDNLLLAAVNAAEIDLGRRLGASRRGGGCRCRGGSAMTVSHG